LKPPKGGFLFYFMKEIESLSALARRDEMTTRRQGSPASLTGISGPRSEKDRKPGAGSRQSGEKTEHKTKSEKGSNQERREIGHVPGIRGIDIERHDRYIQK
jgi:hypothetical protein